MIRKVQRQTVTTVNIGPGEVALFELEELELLEKSNCLRFLLEDTTNGEISFNDLSAKEQAEICRRHRYVRRLYDDGNRRRSKRTLQPVIQDVAQEIDDNSSPSWNTLNNWIKKYEVAGRKLKGLYANFTSSGRRGDRLDPKVTEIIDKCKEKYFSKSQPRVTSIPYVEAKILEHNLENPGSPLKVPTYVTLQRRLENTPYRKKVRGRIGANKARYEFSGSMQRPETFSILERVEADHTKLDIHLIHDDYKTLLGRPTLTILLDHYSSMVVGYQLSFEAPSYASASMAIQNAILPKEKLLTQQGIVAQTRSGIFKIRLRPLATVFIRHNNAVNLSDQAVLL